MNPHHVAWGMVAFLVLAVIDTLARQRRARERNEMLHDIRAAENDQRDSLNGMEQRLAAHFPYRREVESVGEPAFTPAHAELYLSDEYVGGGSDE